MKTIALVLALSIGLIGCNGQEKKSETAKSQTPATELKKEQEQVPKGSWRVNKELDEFGNLIKYDSVYTYSYSTLNGEEVNIEDVDSVIQSFRSYFQDKIPSGWDQNQWHPFWDDSLIEENFFGDKFFQDRWRDKFYEMDARMKHMDSLRDKFFHNFYPGLIESRKSTKDSIN